MITPEIERHAHFAFVVPGRAMTTLAQIDDRDYGETLKNVAFAGAGAGAGAGGALALLLASLGLYGVVALAVRQGTKEIGIRIAVGAEPVRVARMFFASGVRVGAVALAIGLPLSVAALRIGMAQGLIIAPNVNPYLVGSAIAVVLLAVAATATWIPARRAASVDPVRSLREE